VLQSLQHVLCFFKALQMQKTAFESVRTFLENGKLQIHGFFD